MFIYATEMSCTIDVPEKIVLKREIAGDSIEIIRMGIPDGIGPCINEAQIPKTLIRRLYIYLPRALDANTLRHIESIVQTKPYPYLKLMANTMCRLNKQPTNNFFVAIHTKTVPDFSTLTRFIPPNYRKPMLVFIMPDNHISINKHLGFIIINNFIIHITSVHIMLGVTQKSSKVIINDLKMYM